MPLKRVKPHVNDPLWVTTDSRQQAFSNLVSKPFQTGKWKVIVITETLSTGKGKPSEAGTSHLRSNILSIQNQVSGGMQLNVLLDWRHLVALSLYVLNCKFQVSIHFLRMKLPL